MEFITARLTLVLGHSERSCSLMTHLKRNNVNQCQLEPALRRQRRASILQTPKQSDFKLKLTRFMIEEENKLPSWMRRSLSSAPVAIILHILQSFVSDGLGSFLLQHFPLNSVKNLNMILARSNLIY